MAKTAERSAARLAAVQALYQMEVAGKGVIDALAEFEAFWIGREPSSGRSSPGSSRSSARSTARSTRRSRRAGR
jgi:transcription termination factor NusB